MGTATIIQKYSGNAGLFNQGDWGRKYLGKRVSFSLCGVEMFDEVIGTQRHFLCNGEHDILTIELEGERKQVKLEMHRQAVTVMGEKE